TVYGIATSREKIDLFKTIRSKDVDKLISMVNSLANRGTDLRRLTTDLINMAKEAVIYSYSGSRSLLEKLSEKQAQELLDELDTRKLLQCIDCLMDINARYATAVDSMSYFEVGFLKMMELSDEARRVIDIPDNVDLYNKEEPVIAEVKHEIKKLSDDEFLRILLSATRELRQKDEPYWQNVLYNTEDRFAQVVMGLQGSVIMADSTDSLIIVVNDGMLADSLNEKEQLCLLEELIQQEYGTHKDVICITNEKKEQLIQYFQDNKDRQPVINTVSEPEQSDSHLEVTSRLEKLFGPDGFDETED
ncbi:MAG: hypothetical protein IJI05_04810, partial [Erysipelotrichaceae bacterium]|nr:hypothetical protein [Erysipelotrichaceae bacterium]